MQKKYALFLKVLKRFYDTGILNEVILVGSWCMYFYKEYFSPEKYNPSIRTNDLANLWESLEWMLNNDTAAARGKMATRGLYVFTHDNKRGNAPAHNLFGRIKIEKRDNKNSARNFCEYKVDIDEKDLETGISLKKMIHETEKDNCDKQ